MTVDEFLSPSEHAAERSGHDAQAPFRSGTATDRIGLGAPVALDPLRLKGGRASPRSARACGGPPLPREQRSSPSAPPLPDASLPCAAIAPQRGACPYSQRKSCLPVAEFRERARSGAGDWPFPACCDSFCANCATEAASMARRRASASRPVLKKGKSASAWRARRTAGLK